MEIRKELGIYLKHFKKIKDQNPDKSIDDHVGAILYSFMLNPELNMMERDAHYNGVWYALWGNINKQEVDQVKARCAKANPNDKKWTQVCLSAVDEYYKSGNNRHYLDILKIRHKFK